MTLIERDLQHIWHPCEQMKDYEIFQPVQIERAEGSYLYTPEGKPIIDAISSWWCKSLGHGHPAIKRAVQTQMEKFEHVLLANTTNEAIVQLSEQLCALAPGLDKVFYAGDGSSAVEIALKMSLHAAQLRGEPHKTKFMSLENAYHGETALCMSVSDCGIYRSPYEAILINTLLLKGIPYVSGRADPVWSDCSADWPALEAQLNQQAHHLCAIILEPLIQGAGGMLIYSADFLTRLSRWAQANGVYLIADEIMTGIGRTGLAFACEHAGITPDFMCLSKGLTSGWLPLSAVLTRTEIYELFYDDYQSGKAFLHSHTYSGNVLAASAALATLHVIREEHIYQQVRDREASLFAYFEEVADATGCLTHLRGIGGVVAAELETTRPRAGFLLAQAAMRRGALLRPLGNTVYWLPPLNVDAQCLRSLRDITIASIKEIL